MKYYKIKHFKRGDKRIRIIDAVMNYILYSFRSFEDSKVEVHLNFKRCFDTNNFQIL